MGDASPSYRYDAFISYRRVEPDRSHARQLLKELENAGYKVAIDERDFRPQIPFEIEMERCIEESRFTLSIVTPRYFESGNTDQETILAVTRDMKDRQRRLIPLIYEKAKMPGMLFILTGVDFIDPAPLLPPLDRLKATLGDPTIPKSDTPLSTDVSISIQSPSIR